MSMVFIPLLMFIALIVLLVLGVPIVYSLGVVSLSFATMLWGPGSIFGLFSATIGTMNNWILIAVPLFTFMSMVLFETGVVSDLYETFYRFTAKLRGGLCVCSIIVGAIMGAMTGVVAGTVVALSTIALPQMLKYKYDKNIAMGSVLAGGTLGQLIPPSTVMIVYGTMTGVSVGGLFAGGISSGILLVLIYCIYVIGRSYLNKDLCPVMPKEEQVSFFETIKYLKGVIMPLLLIFCVLGSIFTGVATPTEAAAVGSSGALLLAFISKRLSFKGIINASKETLKMTAMVGYITIAASFFGQVFTAIGGNKFVYQLVEMIPFGGNGALIITMLVVFSLGMFLDTIAIVVICAPIFTPIIQAAGFDPLWFAIIFMVNIQTAYLTPPFGFSLFYMKGVAPKGISLGNIYQSAIPFLILQIIGLILIICFPILGLWGIKIFM